MAENVGVVSNIDDRISKLLKRARESSTATLPQASPGTAVGIL